MTDGYMLNTVVNSGSSSVSVSGGKFSQAAFDSVNTILSEQDVQLIEMSPAEADGSFSAAAVGTAAHTHADGDEFTTALSTTGVVTGGIVDGVLAGIFLENGAIEVTVSGGTITGVRAGVLADSSAADIIVHTQRDLSVGDTAGEKNFIAVFKPADTANYNAAEVTLTVTVAPHIEIVDRAKDPTCTESGLTEGKHCSFCGVVLEELETIAALGHGFGDWTVTKEAGIGLKARNIRNVLRGEGKSEIAFPRK